MSVRTHVLAGLALAIGAALTISACSESPMRTGPSPVTASGGTAVTRALDLNMFEICKDYSGVVGPPVTFNVSVDIGNNGSVNQTFTTTLSNGQCAELHGPTDISGGTFSDLVTVTEQVPSGYTVSWVKTQRIGGSVTTTTGTSATASGLTVDTDGGALIIFTNTANPVALGEGRFTGGGNLDLANGTSVSNGLTLHCDLLLSNNLEVNWKDAQGNAHKFHLTDHFQTIACTDAPNILQPPPDAPLDTMIGKGTGKFDNNTASYTVEFTLVDAGEGKDAIDRIALKIYLTSNPSTIVLNFPLTDIIKGNLQAHFDQPHK
jgi:hypothetical protein